MTSPPKMSTIILLSSSPPRAFAHSPTPADSSPLPSPSALLGYGSRASQRFKSAKKSRDGFSGGFSSARSLLSPKIGAENIPMCSGGKDKFKQTNTTSEKGDGRDAVTGTSTIGKAQDSQSQHESVYFKKPQPRRQASSHVSMSLAPATTYTSDLQNNSPRRRMSKNDDEPLINNASSPLLLPKALPRRLDWTPPKPTIEASAATPGTESPSVSFSKDLREKFTLPDCSAAKSGNIIGTSVDFNGAVTKRRRIDLVTTRKSSTEALSAPTESIDVRELPNDTKKRRNRSPAKKGRTITALATSNYGEDYQKGQKIAPMLEYLTATQVNADREPEEAVAKTAKKTSRANPSVRKPRTTRKVLPKSRLESPTSVMKTVNGQEFMFGSASQLARDESPSLVRDTLEALKRPEYLSSSDPISPQRTQPFSIESTSPNASRGTRRFAKRRNLWSAAGRDEDNALLHVDTIDLVDSPAVRLALAGKDVLLAPSVSKLPNTGNIQTALHINETPLANKIGALLDIDEIVTPAGRIPAKAPAPHQARSYHTSRTLEERRNRTASAKGGETAMAPPEKTPVAKKKAVPAKPNYAGFPTHDLQKQISAFGFKVVKKREKMIELLERCWEDKHGTSPAVDEKEVASDPLTHGDFLSKVHDVSARPGPKVPKPRAKRKATAVEAPVGEEPTPKKSRTGTKTPTAKEAKTPRKQAAKKVLSEETVMDVDDLDESKAVSNKLQDDVVESTAKKVSKRKGKAVSPTKKPATPPPTLPLISLSSPGPENRGASLAVQDHARDSATSFAGAMATPEQTPVFPDLYEQIHAAIHFRPQNRPAVSPEDPRNHAVSPTWREKMLMYDPIVLEDLTAWLNTEGFRAIGEDREVGAVDVQKWCEQNGVCCLWKGGWRGRRKG